MILNLVIYTYILSLKLPRERVTILISFYMAKIAHIDISHKQIFNGLSKYTTSRLPIMTTSTSQNSIFILFQFLSALDFGSGWIHGAGEDNPLVGLAKNNSITLYSTDTVKGTRWSSANFSVFDDDVYIQTGVEFIDVRNYSLIR